MQFDFDLRPCEDLPASALARLQAAGPVVWSNALAGWLVSGAAQVRTVLSDLSRFTSAGTPVAEVFNGEGMLVNDTAMHHTIRAVWARHVSRPAMDVRCEEFAEMAANVLAPALPTLAAGESADFMPLFRQMVLAAIARLFAIPQQKLGVFESWAQLSANTPALGLVEGSEEHRRHEAGKIAVYDLIDEEVSKRRAGFAAGEQPNDLIGHMVASVGHNGITETIMRDNVFNFILGAIDTTERWMGNTLERLAISPSLADELRTDRTRLEPFIEEVMRTDTVAQVIQRRVRENGAELGGQRLGAGDAVYIMLGAANRDPAEFDIPDQFDLHRPAMPHFGFGFGFHHCLGLNIARAEVLAFTSAVLDALPELSVAECDRGASWALWGPRELRLQRREIVELKATP